MESYIQISTTTDSIESARELASVLLKEKRAACIQIIPNVESHYKWENKLEVTSEFLLLIKTFCTQEQYVVEIIRAIHPYSTPEIISNDIDILDKRYGEWFKSSMES